MLVNAEVKSIGAPARSSDANHFGFRHMSIDVENWLFRTFGAVFGGLMLGSARTKQIEAGAPIHPSLQQFQLGDLSLGLPI